ncbi:transferrin-binding protein-like solute binding protein [Actinobacillus equuli]|uniref:transferrin-binding protein-like solute binding protein n=1 Tax=Actinobacillus equuli TaxID=718 RepID=UPI0024430781|nr:transferrin-binding protein-like solute binding protein [Actinobacillus equuli]WGE84916.1 transferrin-binding protein-like solute binding protein [Actinobacillus equuli subsp. haemolyticus]
MNKNLRLSLIAIACSLAITACSSDNKGATRYENLVKNKTEEATKRAEEKAKRAQESDTAKKLADLEKKQKELEAELAKKQNGNTAAPSVSGNVPSNVITPSTPAKSKDVEEAKPTEKKEPEVKASVGKVLSTEEAKKALEGAFKDNGLDESRIQLSGGVATLNNKGFTSNSVQKTDKDLNTLMVDGTEVTLISLDTMKSHRKDSDDILDDNYEKVTNKIFNFKEEKGRVGSLPHRSLGNDFEQMRYGYYTENGETKLFVQGYLTPTNQDESGKHLSPFNYRDESMGKSSMQGLRAIPTNGVYEYKGTAFYGKDHSYNEYTTTAYADFDSNKVQVNILDGEKNKLTFGGNIDKNTFSGEYNGVVSNGAFFGTKATDIGGIFYQTKGNEQGMHGVFGATQQNCTKYGGCKPIENHSLADFKASK